MKNFLFGILAISISTFSVTNGLHAQNQTNPGAQGKPDNINVIGKAVTTANASIAGADSISTRALKDFSKKYRNVTPVSWEKIKDGFTASFIINDVVYTVYYNTRGKWTGSLKRYVENKMPHDIRDIVKREYYDYSISSVDEVVTIDSKGIPTYLIHLHYKNNIKLVSVSDNQMDVREEFQES